jgi:hypothetical protein
MGPLGEARGISVVDKVDFTGARGSNAGDKFHVLWALHQMLKLLDVQAKVKAVGVEGVSTETPGDDSSWDGVDVALYFGGLTLETTTQIDLVQLKYSSAYPDSKWSVAKLTSSTAKKENNSVLRRMASAFTAAKSKIKPGSLVNIRLVSNQAVSPDFIDLLNKIKAGASIPAEHNDSLKVLKSASGLSDSEFSEFIDRLDLSQCGRGSRFDLEEKVVGLMTDLLGDDVISEVRELQTCVRDLMLPERHGEIVQERTVLAWFGLSSREGLFPCPPEIRAVPNPVIRPAAAQAIQHLSKGERLLLVHGAGGCGKTTLMRQIVSGLPAESISVIFDCFGGGRYMYSDEKRHLAENAFLQLSNEISIALELPLFVPRSHKNPANIQSFMMKLKAAGTALRGISSSALLVIVIDAADNSISAAEAASPMESSFVFDLIRANLAGLPANVRFIFSSRTSRRDMLGLATGTVEVECPPFSLIETQKHIETHVSGINTATIEQFHALSHGNPRVQTYAIEAAREDKSALLEVLRPAGKKLDDVLQITFEKALLKIGQKELFSKLIAALANLPSPASVEAVARVSGTTSEIVRDLALDLMPGLRIQDDAILIADEDIEAFIKNAAEKERGATVLRISDYFLETYLKDPYSSLHLADALVKASRAEKLLGVLEGDPDVIAISDPIIRRQVQVRRLRLSLVACRRASSTIDAVKTILISAEAEKDDDVLNDVIEKEMDLSVEFSGPSVRRTILLNRDRAKDQGRFLIYDAARASRAGDFVTTRERLYFYGAWLDRRKEISRQEQNQWSISSQELAARFEAILNIADSKTAFDDLMRWTPETVPIEVALVLVPRLVSQGKSHVLRGLLDDGRVPKPWDLIFHVALAVAGEPVKAKEVESSLRRIHPIIVPDPTKFTNYYHEDGWSAQLLDTFISSCELGYFLDVKKVVLLRAINRILKVLSAPGRKLFRFDFARFDGLVRCWLLRAALLGQELKENDFIDFVKSSANPDKGSKSTGSEGEAKSKNSRDDQDAESVLKKIRALYVVYSARQTILTLVRDKKEIEPSAIENLGVPSQYSYELDYDHDGMDWRRCAAVSVIKLLMVPKIKPEQLLAKASTLVQGRFGDPFGTRRLVLWKAVRNRVNEVDSLLKLVSTAKKEIKSAQAPASEKIDALIRLSRFVLPISQPDAGALFGSAVSIAKEIDQEALDQIDLASVAANFANLDSEESRRQVAGRLFAFITAASRRLSGRDFGWVSGICALASLYPPAAFAAVARWSDWGLARLDETVEPMLIRLLGKKAVNAQTAISLTVLSDESSANLLKCVVKSAQSEGQIDQKVVEEASRNVLLLNSQEDRGKIGAVFLEQIKDLNFEVGPWCAKLKATVNFLNENSQRIAAQRDSSAHQYSEAGSGEQFEFSYKGPFNSPSRIEEILKASLVDGYPRKEREILIAMMTASSAAPERVPFLDALANLSEDVVWISTKADILTDAITRWKGAPAVDHWCNESLPKVVSNNFHGFAQYLKQGGERLRQILEFCPGDPNLRLSIILDGVALTGQGLGSRALFGVSEILCELMDPVELGELVRWYSIRLFNRIPVSERESGFTDHVPGTVPESIARFLFAQLSDIDTRIRWRAAHALRALARMGECDLLAEVVRQRDRMNDVVFRDPNAPYYFLAAKLWLTIALYRVSAETPFAVKQFKMELLDIATSKKFPHVAIREYAKRTLTLLKDSKVLSFTAKEAKALNLANAAEKGETDRQQGARKRFDRNREPKQRFRYDETDTIPYWYQPLLGVFPGVSQQQFLDITDKWIVDEWKANPEANWWDKEPRKDRYDERNYNSWGHRHGSLPVVERFGTYLEWHAMHCAAGELLTSSAVSDDGEEYGGFPYWLKHFMPTDAPEWLSDKRGPTPLEIRFWADDSASEDDWLDSNSNADFLKEIMPSESVPEDWMVVAGAYSISSQRRETDIEIESALVSSETATALVKTLQAADHYDYGIPHENDNLEIDSEPYNLTGWLAGFSGEAEFDERDPLRYEVRLEGAKPGKAVSKFGNIKLRPGINKIWFLKNSDEQVFRLEVWCDEPSRDRSYVRRIKSNGWRLSGKKSFIQSFLADRNQDLLCEVKIVRRVHREYRRSDEEEKSKTQTKILLCRKEGEVEDSSGSIGAWKDPGKGTAARPKRHSRKVDGSSRRRVVGKRSGKQKES